MTLPLAVSAGSTSRVVLRGWDLENASAVRVVRGMADLRIVSQGNAAVPDKLQAAQVGDKQVEVELILPATPAHQVLALVVDTPSGTSEPRELWVGSAAPAGAVAEKESNNSLRGPQLVEVGQDVDGQIQSALDTDVFEFEAEGGRRLVLEIESQRRGQALDGLLTLFSPQGAVLVARDDQPGTSDPQLVWDVPIRGKYRVVVSDAADRGGPLHWYRLQIRYQPR